jgi:hypothetical protein
MTARAVKPGVFLTPGQITPAVLAKIRALNGVAQACGVTPELRDGTICGTPPT